MASTADLELGAAFGVSALVVSALRAEHLREPDDYRFEGVKRRLVYSDAGRAKLEAVIEAQKNGGGAAAGRLPPAGPHALPGQAFTLWLPKKNGAAPPVLLMIVRIYPNRTWIGVQLPNGRLGQIRVRNNALLKRGNRLLCQQGADGAWVCAHRRQAFPQ